MGCAKLVHTIGSVNINSCSKRSPFSSAVFSMLKKFRMNDRAALGSEAGLKGKRRKGISRALDFNSFVQPLNSSCISSGSTSFRVQASPSQSGFGGGEGGMAPFVWELAFFFDLGEATPPASFSLPRSLEKIRMLDGGGAYVRAWFGFMGIVSRKSWVGPVGFSHRCCYLWRCAMSKCPSRQGKASSR